MKTYVKYAVTVDGVLIVGHSRDEYMIIGTMPEGNTIQWREPCSYEIIGGRVNVYDNNSRRIFSSEIQEAV